MDEWLALWRTWIGLPALLGAVAIGAWLDALDGRGRRGRRPRRDDVIWLDDARRDRARRRRRCGG